MQNTFLEKKNKLLEALRMLALKHNRDYYVSIIPFVEQLVEEQEDIVDMYSYALHENAQTLFQSRQALMAHHLVEFLL